MGNGGDCGNSGYRDGQYFVVCQGGNLTTVLTVMGFVLTLVAAQFALVALGFQIVGNDISSSGSS